VRKAAIAVLVVVVLVGMAAVFGRPVLLRWVQSRFLSTGPNGPATPGDLEMPFERVGIASGPRRLDGYLVRAEPAGRPEVTVLLFHGAGETISDWVGAQKVLFDHGISSLVFDYSGHGDSSRPGTIPNLNADAAAAYAFFVARFGAGRRCVLGFSMGTAPMLAAYERFQPAPCCVVVAAAFSSLRELGAKQGTPGFVLGMVPDVWNNVRAVTRVHAPLLVLHSDADRSDPLEMGARIYEAANEPKSLVVLHGPTHNAPIREPTGGWWEPVVDFVLGSAEVAARRGSGSAGSR
jgi:uncharacterized protein